MLFFHVIFLPLLLIVDDDFHIGEYNTKLYIAGRKAYACYSTDKCTVLFIYIGIQPAEIGAILFIWLLRTDYRRKLDSVLSVLPDTLRGQQQ